MTSASFVRTPDGQWAPRRPLLTLFTLWLVVFASASQIILIAPLLPDIAEQLGMDEGPLGLLMTVYSAALGVFTLVAGPISDRVGRRRVILWGAAGMAVALALHGLARDFASLLALRTLAGAAAGVLSGAAVAYVGDAFPSERRGWANGWVMSGFAVGQIVGIPIGLALSDHFGFRAPFLAFAVVMMGATVLAIAALPQPPGARSSAPLSLGAALGEYRALVARRDTLAAALVYLVMFLGVGLFVVFLPTWLERTRGFTSGQISWMYALGGAANVAAGPQAGKLSDRVGRKGVVVVGSIGVGLLMAMTTVVGTTAWAIYALFIGFMTMGAARMSPLQALLTEMVEGPQRGAFMSLTTATGQVGFAVGSALAGPVFAGLGFLTNALLGGATAVAAAAVVWYLLPEGPPKPPPPPADLADRPVEAALAAPVPEGGHMAEAAVRR